VSVPQIRIPDKLVPVFTGDAMYRGAYGGRGSAKTRTFAKMAAVRGLMFAEAGLDGVIVCGREFMNSLDDSSLAEVKAAILEEPWLAAKYDVGEKFVRTKDGLINFAFIGLRHNLDSIKSKAKIRLLWVDEAEPVSESAWMKAIPTVREEGAEIWVTWNPERKKSATHKRFRKTRRPIPRSCEMNWRDNPWFPSTLNKTSAWRTRPSGRINMSMFGAGIL
jgi:phage terminase large subunit